MKFLIVISMFCFGSLAYANPEVTKGTDIGKRKVKQHYQVTKCDGDDCTINAVTHFSKKDMKKKFSYGECVFLEEKGMRVSRCYTSTKKKEVEPRIVRITTFKEVTKKAKKNRLYIHAGFGPTGLKQSSDNNTTAVKEDMDLVGGLGYTRLLNETYSAGATIFTNKTTVLSLGFDY